MRLRRRGVITGAWGTTERRQLALSSAKLHQGTARTSILQSLNASGLDLEAQAPEAIKPIASAATYLVIRGW